MHSYNHWKNWSQKHVMWITNKWNTATRMTDVCRLYNQTIKQALTMQCDLPADHDGTHSPPAHVSFWQTPCPAEGMHMPPTSRSQLWDCNTAVHHHLRCKCSNHNNTSKVQCWEQASPKKWTSYEKQLIIMSHHFLMKFFYNNCANKISSRFVHSLYLM